MDAYSNSDHDYLQEAKAISILKRLLYNIYERRDSDINSIDDTTCIANISDNPFDLAHKIYLQLQQTVNNIKTQLVIGQMTGENVYRAEKLVDKQNVVKARKDDWAVDENNIIHQSDVQIETPSL